MVDHICRCMCRQKCVATRLGHYAHVDRRSTAGACMQHSHHDSDVLAAKLHVEQLGQFAGSVQQPQM